MRLRELGVELLKILDVDSTLVIVSDENVSNLYLKECENSLNEKGFKTFSFIMKAGEENKNIKVYLELVNFMAEREITRTDAVIALGGGVVGDLAGFAAATYLRGIKIIQVPTTLLSAVDSSIGGKTGINLSYGKNLLGAFHQPTLIFNDDKLLKTLPKNVFKDGIGEVIKYGMIYDEVLFNNLKDVNYLQDNLDEVVSISINIKEKFVKEDEFDKGIRQILNFGHTFGHAIEKLSNYTIGHGSAVAVGMDIITEISVKQNWCSESSLEELRQVLNTYGFNINRIDLCQKILGHNDVDILNKKMLQVIKADKKRKGNTIDLVVPVKIGKCVLKRLDIQSIEELL